MGSDIPVLSLELNNTEKNDAGIFLIFDDEEDGESFREKFKHKIEWIVEHEVF